jgi:hypothetical protein
VVVMVEVMVEVVVMVEIMVRWYFCRWGRW